MRRNYPRYTLRVSKEVLYKLKCICEFNGRTKNKEIEQVLKRHINEFEKKYGVINVPSDISEEE
ncbi:MAG: TraY domain-containing protein [Clostridia bacterium]|nr:TraY domain-containing protein [Clostridia bacterium]MBQ8792885.1 TraY domain-containing protein [Clostridia bacterium]